MLHIAAWITGLQIALRLSAWVTYQRRACKGHVPKKSSCTSSYTAFCKYHFIPCTEEDYVPKKSLQAHKKTARHLLSHVKAHRIVRHAEWCPQRFAEEFAERIRSTRMSFSQTLVSIHHMVSFRTSKRRQIGIAAISENRIIEHHPCAPIADRTAEEPLIGLSSSAIGVIFRGSKTTWTKCSERQQAQGHT